MKRLFAFLQIMLIAIAVMAVPARPGSFKVTQKDGSVLTVRLVGDEHMSYFINEANGQKMYRDVDDELKPLSEQRFNQMKAVAVERRAMIEKARAERMQANRAVRANNVPGGPKKVGVVGGMIGSKKGLVILVNFADKAFVSTQKDFDDQFNKVGYNANYHVGSVHDYFFDQSYGQFDLTFDVVGPVTVSKNMSYYGAKKNGDNDSYPAQMVIEACQLVDDQVNFADYDWDGNGYVDQVFVVYAGYSEAQGAPSTTIWPHEYDLNSAASFGDGSGMQRLDGVIVNTYACSCELSGNSGNTMDGIGTACHEFSHCLGYPDFYDTDYSGGWGMGPWDVLDAGSYNGFRGKGEAPCGYTSYERWLAGWVDPVELVDPVSIKGMKPLNDSPEAYVIYNDKNRNEYILLENRKNDKWFKYVPSFYTTNCYGMLALHVDYDERVWAMNAPNDNPSHQRMTIIPANKRYDSSYARHPFGGSGGVAELTATSHSAAGGVWWTACSTGSTALNHELTNISYSTSAKTISFDFDGGDPVDDGTRYTVTYNAGSGSCEFESWTQTDFLESAVMPEAVGAKPGYVFVGWSKNPVDKTKVKPEDLYAAGSTVKVRENITLYAVYEYLYQPSSEVSYKYVTALSKDKAYVFASSKESGEVYTLDAEALASETPLVKTATVRAMGDDMVLINPALTSVWECDYSSGNIRHLHNDGNYLVASIYGLAVNTTAANVLWTASWGLYLQVGASRYYVHPSTDGTFNVNKTAGNPVFAFEVMGERAATYYASTFDYYALTYMIDDAEYKSFTLEAGSTIVPIDDPVREGYNFLGWEEEIPEVMPANDLVIHGSFEQISEEDGIANVGSGHTKHATYTLQGQRVKTTDLHSLPAGIYIVDSRKVVVR